MLHSFRHDDPLFRLRSLVASKGMATDDQTSFKNISFEDISFEDISFEDISFKDISFEDISFEEISFSPNVHREYEGLHRYNDGS